MTDYLRKRIVTVVFGTSGVCLISCAKTPEKKVVVDKSRLIKRSSLGKEHPKGSGVPVYWAETIEKNDGFHCLTDYKMQIPKDL